MVLIMILMVLIMIQVMRPRMVEPTARAARQRCWWVN